MELRRAWEIANRDRTGPYCVIPFLLPPPKNLTPQGPRKLPKLDVAGSTPVARSLRPPWFLPGVPRKAVMSPGNAVVGDAASCLARSQVMALTKGCGTTTYRGQPSCGQGSLARVTDPCALTQQTVWAPQGERHGTG
jgi:hypothetical protein